MGGIQCLPGRGLPLLAMDAGAGAAATRPAAVGLLGRPARRQYAPGTAWAADGGHVPRRRGPLKSESNSLSAGCKPMSSPISYTCRTSCSPDWPVRSASGWRAGHRHVVGRNSFLEKLPRRTMPGPDRVARPGRGAGGTGGLVRILRRFMAEYLAVPRGNRRDPTRFEPRRYGGKAEGGRMKDEGESGAPACRSAVARKGKAGQDHRFFSRICATKGCTCLSTPCMR